LKIGRFITFHDTPNMRFKSTSEHSIIDSNKTNRTSRSAPLKVNVANNELADTQPPSRPQLQQRDITDILISTARLRAAEIW
jgi:hypothetical protein